MPITPAFGRSRPEENQMFKVSLVDKVSPSYTRTRHRKGWHRIHRNECVPFFHVVPFGGC